MSSNTPKVGIILVNYNGTQDSLECLASLAKITYPNYMVVVVDNASTDTHYVLERIHREFPLVQTIPVSENLGFAGGNNVGIKTALAESAEYVLLLNNDTVVAPDFVDKLVAAAESDAAIGMVGAKTYYFSERETIWFDGADFSWRQGGKHTHDGVVDINPSDATIRETTYVTGCTLLVKKEVVEKIGLLSEDFFMYYEDIDWSLHATKAGYKIVVAPASHVWHKVSRSAVKMGRPRIHYYHARNALILTKRNAPFLTRLGVYAWSVWHFKKQIIKIAIFPSSRPIARAILRGILDFYRGKFGKTEAPL